METLIEPQAKQLFYANTLPQKVCVTGAAGFIGHHLTNALADLGHPVLAVDNLSTGRIQNLEPLISSGRVSFLKTDINRIGSDELEGCETIFHQAALPRIMVSIQQPEKTHKANVLGTLHLLNEAVKSGVKTFIYAASSSAYGPQTVFPLREDMTPNPANPYAVQKLCGEYYGSVFSSLYKIRFVALRYFNVYGPGQDDRSPYTGVITLFKKAVRKNKPFTICGSGEQTRDFTFIQDVVKANIQAMKNTNASGIYNIGSGKETSILELARMIGGKDYPIRFLDPRPGDVSRTLAYTFKAMEDFEWYPKTQIEEAIKTF